MNKRETKTSLCVHCGKTATRMNSAEQPVCKKHKDSEPVEMECPSCGFSMRIKEGKYGYFWGCEGYPGCKKTLSIKNSLKMRGALEDKES
ncbi:MAG: topoisomerase DNA-binding C4 zinc finger domain-containing protein [Candidatus Nanohaloarchaea archaeon]|nr:topoisomerase DNA-binding C4 zinc finger domain-containing protein [Candidatus Nanohaloarchaea archaeon]